VIELPKLLTSFLIIFLTCAGQANAQSFSDKNHYLVDSLEIDKISESDLKLIDSCLTIFHKSKHDTDKINAIVNIVEESWDDKIWPKYNLWLYYFTKNKLKKNASLNTTKKLYKTIGSVLNNIGYYNSSKGNIPRALKYYEKSLVIQKKINDKTDVATSLNNIGSIHNKQGNITRALDYYLKSLKIYEELNNKNGLAQILNNIGHIYHNQEDYNLALEYFNRGLKIYTQLNHKRNVATLLNSIGFAYFKKKNIPKTLEYYNQSLSIREELQDKKGMASSYNNLGAAHENQLNHKVAMEYYLKSTELYVELGSKLGLSITLNNIGRIYFNKGNLSKAKEHINQSIKLAREIGSPDNIQQSAKLLSLIYEKEGHGLKALEMNKLYVKMRDSLNNENTQKATIRQQAKYEYEKEKVIDDAQNQKLVAVEKKEKEKQKVISFAIAIGLVFVVAFLLFIFNRLKITRKQKILIEIQNQEIVDSITYAKRIQEAILPTDEIIKSCLPCSFLFYQPKDIVAGDFYWVEKNRDTVLFAVADCTGHGVPGALVSVVCHNAMDRAIREYKLSDPGEILDRTRKIVTKQLNKPQSSEIDSLESIRDGMDIALCKLDTNSNTLQYSGAYNPLWILREGANEIEEIKADRQAIGKVDNPIPYKTHHVNLSNGDTIYIFSDGFADQFNGNTGKKMMRRGFKKLLVSMKNQTIEDQLKSINSHFFDWKGESEQVDDVCLIGVKI